MGRRCGQLAAAGACCGGSEHTVVPFSAICKAALPALALASLCSACRGTRARGSPEGCRHRARPFEAKAGRCLLKLGGQCSPRNLCALRCHKGHPFLCQCWAQTRRWRFGWHGPLGSCTACVKSRFLMPRADSSRLPHHLVIILMSGSCSHGPKHH